MSKERYRWADFPFGVAGPMSLAQSAVTSLAGGLSLLFAPPRLQLWIGLAVALASWGILAFTRQRFARRRNLNAHVVAHALGTKGYANQTFLIGAALVSVIIPRAFGWHDGAIFVLYGATLYAQELNRLRAWRASGFAGAGSSRWARDDRKPSEDTPG